MFCKNIKHSNFVHNQAPKTISLNILKHLSYQGHTAHITHTLTKNFQNKKATSQDTHTTPTHPLSPEGTHHFTNTDTTGTQTTSLNITITNKKGYICR